MNEGLIPRRYAKALYEVAAERGDDGRVYELAKNLDSQMAHNPALQTVMSNPFVSVADKDKMLETAAGATDADRTWSDFLRLLARNKRYAEVRQIAIAYAGIYRQRHNIYPVEVVSAAELTDDETDRLRKLISAHLDGATMEFNTRVDPELIGGFVINIDSERLDASVKNELEQLRFNLLRK